MDDQPGWRLLEPGELLVVDGLNETSLFPFERLRHPLSRAELSAREAASQQTAVAGEPVQGVKVGALQGATAVAGVQAVPVRGPLTPLILRNAKPRAARGPSV
jgi:glutamine amidotransferase